MCRALCIACLYRFPVQSSASGLISYAQIKLFAEVYHSSACWHCQSVQLDMIQHRRWHMCYLCLHDLGLYSLRQLFCLCDLCRPWAIKYAEDEQLFFGDYAKAQVKLSELGSKWAPGAPYVLDI